MTSEEMTNESIEKIKSCSDESLQVIWDHLCADFFLADTSKKAELVAYSAEKQREFLQDYAQQLLKGASYVEPFWRFVVKEEQFSF